MTPTDADLVRQVLQGNPEAFSELMARHQDYVHGFAYHLVENFEDARDLAQESFVRAYLHLGQLRDPARFGPWLRRITHRVCLDWLEARRAADCLSLEGFYESGQEIADPAPPVAEQVEQRQVQQTILAAVRRLSESYRLPFTLFHLDGLSYEGVAEFLDLPLGTVKTRIHRARQMLQEELSCLAEETFHQIRLEQGPFRDSVQRRLQHWLGVKPRPFGTQWIAFWLHTLTPRQALRKLCLPDALSPPEPGDAAALAADAEPAEAAVRADPQEAAAWTRLGRARLAQGNVSGARTAFQKALPLSPQDPFALNNLGVVQECAENLDACLELYRQAYQAAPDEAQIGCNLGEMLASIGRWEEAQAVLGAVLEAHPDCARAHFREGWEWMCRDDLERALQHAAAIPTEGPEAHLGHRLRGHVAMIEHRPEEARQHFLRACEQAEDPVVLCDLASVASPAEDVTLCRRATKLDPAYRRAWNNLGVAYYNMRCYPEAEAALRTVLKIAPHDTIALANLGYHLYPEMGRWDEALKLARRHDRLAEGQPGMGVGLLLERAGRLDAALQHGRQLAHRTGRYLPLTLTQVRQQVARGNFAKARALWPAPGTELKEGEWESLSATGWAYVRAGRWDEAVYFFQWALREQPRWARWFHAYLATTHRAAGHLAAARAHAQAAVDLDDQFAPGWTELGLAWEVEGQSDKAQAAYRRALAADPYCPVTHAALSRLEEGPPRELPGAIEWLW